MSAIWQSALTTFLVVGAALTALAILQRHLLMFDFTGDLYNAGSALIAGRNPYKFQFIESLAALKRAGGFASPTFAVPVYPPPVLLLFLPLSFLPLPVAGALFAAGSVSAVIVGLRLLGVRDWRCLLIVLCSYPTVGGVLFGTLSPWLLLAAGVVWRCRTETWVPSVALSAAVVSKIFPWPLLLWALVTRRIRLFIVSLTMSATVTLLSWAAIGFAGLSSYPRMLSDLSYVEAPFGISPFSILLHQGLTATASMIGAVVLSMALISCAWHVARRPAGNGQAFSLFMLVALTASPLVWSHYLILVFVPIALASPRLSLVWATPLLMYLAPRTPDPGRIGEMIPLVGMQIICVAHILLQRGPAGAGRPAGMRSGGLRYVGRRTRLLRQPATSRPQTREQHT